MKTEKPTIKITAAAMIPPIKPSFVFCTGEAGALGIPALDTTVVGAAVMAVAVTVAAIAGAVIVGAAVVCAAAACGIITGFGVVVIRDLELVGVGVGVSL